MQAPDSYLELDKCRFYCSYDLPMCPKLSSAGPPTYTLATMSVPPSKPSSSSPSSATDSTETPPAANKSGANAVPKTILDLVFTLVIPIIILSPNILGSGISVSQTFFGGGTQGNIYAYVLAALIPVGYVFWDLLANKNVSPVALIGGAGALFSGALTFWFVDGFWYAIKDSARSYLLAVFFFVSAFTPIPLFRVFLDAAAIGDPPQQRALVQQAWRDSAIHRALAQASLAFAGVDLVGGIVNSVVNYQRVVAKFGSDDFNAQVAEVNAIMRLPSFAISIAGVALAFWIVQTAVQKRYGKEASALDNEKLAAAVANQQA